MSTYRARPGPVVGLAVLVFGTAAVLETLVESLNLAVGGSRILGAVLSLVSGPVSITTLGLVLYAGVLDRVVGHHLHDHPRMTVRDAVRTLAWGRLLVADVILTAATALGIALLVLPGLVFFTFFCLVGPIVNIEDAGAVSAFRRSATLVRRAPWLTAGLVTGPTAVEVLLLHGFHFLTADFPYVAAFTVSAVIGATVGATVGLFEVTLAYALIHSERQAAAAASAGAPP